MLEQFGAGPYGTMFLAELGAEVIKVEAPDGDPSRHVGPYKLGPADSEYFQAWNLGKKSVTLDLKSTTGRRQFEALVKSADCVVNNMRGTQPTKLGIDYASLKHLNASIVCLHISCWAATPFTSLARPRRPVPPMQIVGEGSVRQQTWTHRGRCLLCDPETLSRGCGLTKVRIMTFLLHVQKSQLFLGDALGKSVYPFAPVGEYQSDIGASSASGQPLRKRSTRSGLLMNGRPKEMRSACPAAIAFSADSLV